MTATTRAARATELAHVTCRVFGHAWSPITPDRRTRIGWYLWVECSRCTSVRMDTLDLHGNVSARSYRYPDGYRRDGKITRADWRLELRRLTVRTALRAVP